MNFIDNVFLITDNDPAGPQEGFATHKVRLSDGTIEEHGSLTHFSKAPSIKRHLIGAKDVPLSSESHTGVLNLGDATSLNSE